MCGSRLLVSAWCWMTDRGRERDPPPEQEAAARTTVNTEETPNNVDISGHRDIPPSQNVEPSRAATVVCQRADEEDTAVKTKHSGPYLRRWIMKELQGCGMRSSVGFLSRRELTGQPLMKEEFQRRRLAGCTSLFKKDMLGHFGCVNAIEFSNNGGEWLVSGKLTNQLMESEAVSS